MKVKKGKEAFEEYYHSLFPDKEEFQKFLRSLKEKRLPILRFNKKDAASLKKLWLDQGLSWETLSWYPTALIWPKEVEYGTILPGYRQHLIYPMSPSSLLPVLALELESNDNLLDACAAPGGKTLAAIDKIGSSKQVIANDLSYARAMKMKRVFADYGVYVDFSIKPAEKLDKLYPETFNKILVDAPCSSEQHVYTSKKHLSRWSIKRIKKLQNRQIKMITRLVECLNPGGRLVYSTCAITPAENEEVVSQILDSPESQLQLVDFDWSELPGNPGYNKSATFNPKAVRRIIPHLDNMDPIFVAIFEKK